MDKYKGVGRPKNVLTMDLLWIAQFRQTEGWWAQMHVRETSWVFTLFVVCINYLLVYDDAVINYKFEFTTDRHQSTPANLSYSQCAHSLTVFLYNTCRSLQNSLQQSEICQEQQREKVIWEHINAKFIQVCEQASISTEKSLSWIKEKWPALFWEHKAGCEKNSQNSHPHCLVAQRVLSSCKVQEASLKITPELTANDGTGLRVRYL